MIKIIKPGRIRIITCPYCDCVFSFSKKDIKYRDRPEITTFIIEEIDCPCCKEIIEILGLDKED